MNYYSKEVTDIKFLYKTAGVKARDDVEYILRGIGYKEIGIPTLRDDRKNVGKVKKVLAHFKVRNLWNKMTKELSKGDTILIQYPIREHTIFLSSVLRNIRKRGAKIIFLIHDLDSLRYEFEKETDVSKLKGKRLEIEQKALHFGNRIIVHNKAMLEKMVELGFDRRKLVSLEIFDYIVPEDGDKKAAEGDDSGKNGIGSSVTTEAKGERVAKELPVIIAGNLSKVKSEYIYKLPESVKFNLYGVNYEGEEKENISYKGSFMPDELPHELSGSFGLVWDGESAETCSGVYGEYLRINNPHKTSLYLASGIPVIIWSKAALADFVKENKVGIVVDSLYNIPDVLGWMTAEEYNEMKKNAGMMAKKLRDGEFTKKALKENVRH